METAIVGMGCFWCSEAIYQSLRGVQKVESGYAKAAGSVNSIEVARIQFDPEVITYEDLLLVFWELHDPTQANGQGYDIGPEYQSAIFYCNSKQKDIAIRSKETYELTHTLTRPVVTRIEPFGSFSLAATFHQDFYKKNPENRLCKVIISPKLAKLRKIFGHLEKE